MPSLRLDNRLIWFAHCPKSGGTSIERILVERFGDAVGHLHWGWDLWWKGGGWRCCDPPNSPQHLIWADALGAMPRIPDTVFTVVRDPVARMVSEYRYQRGARRGTKAGRVLAYLPFPLWLRLMLRLARVNPYAFDNHLRPQSDFVPDTAQVFHFENGLEPVAIWLAGLTGADEKIVLPRLLQSAGAAVKVAPRDRALIGHVFAVDYARFGYNRPTSEPSARRFADLAVRLLLPMVRALERCGRL